jgi:3-mercaptopyruvate sulfurtransferase SseA
MLRWVGFDRAAVLDGGLRAWKTEDRPMSRKPATHPSGSLATRPRPELFADRAEVLAAIDDNRVHIIDALPVTHYSGEMSVYSRAGHITGAINASMLQLVDKTGRSRDPHASLELANGMHRLTRRGNLISFISNKTTPKRAVCCLPDEAIRDRRAYGVIGSANLAALRWKLAWQNSHGGRKEPCR